MTRYATILLLAATINAQFAGDAAAGGAATKPKLSKFGETVATQKDKEGADEFTHGREFAEFMKLEVGDMTPRETGANKWAYDPRYNRGLRLPDGIYNILCCARGLHWMPSPTKGRLRWNFGKLRI